MYEKENRIALDIKSELSHTLTYEKEMNITLDYGKQLEIKTTYEAS